MAFLTTRVKALDTNDWNKLLCLMGCIKATLDMALTLEVENFSVLKQCMDASFTVYPATRQHTGDSLTLGKGSVFNKGTKQKLMAKAVWKWRQLELMM